MTDEPSEETPRADEPVEEKADDSRSSPEESEEKHGETDENGGNVGEGASTGQSEGPGSVLVKIARAIFIILFFQLFWKLGGFFLNFLIAWFWGPSPESDAFLFVNENVIFLLQTLSLKIFIPLIIPIFKSEQEKSGDDQAWRFLNTVVNLVLILQALVMVAGMMYAAEFVRLTGEGFNRETEELAIHIMRWSMPGVFLISFATVTYAILNSHNEFGFAAAGDAAQKSVWFLGFLVLGILWGKLAGGVSVDAMIISFLAGAVANLLTHLYGLRNRLHRYRPRLPLLSLSRAITETGLAALAGLFLVGTGLWLSHAGTPTPVLQAICASVAGAYLLLVWWRARKTGSALAKFASLAVPLLVGILFAKYRDLFTNYFGTFTGKGGFTDLKLARKIGELPNTLIAQAVGLGILPYLCELAQNHKWEDFEHVMTKTLKVMFMVFVPLTIATVVLRESLVELLFNRGGWDVFHIQHAGLALGLYILGLLFFAIENPLQQSFFSMQRMWTPTFIGFVNSAFQLLFLFLCIKIYGLNVFLMVALVVPLGRILKGLLLIVVMRFIIPILPFAQTGLFLLKMAVVCLALGSGMWWIHARTTRALPLGSYRERRVEIDTFNVEDRGWNSENLLDFEVAARPGAADNHCLAARYILSPRRQAAIHRNVNEINLEKGKTLSVEVRANRAAQIAIQLQSVTGALHSPQLFALEPNQWTALEFHISEDPESGVWDLLILRDASDERRMIESSLYVDNLKAGSTTLDDFEPSSSDWTAVGGRVQVVDVEEDQCAASLVAQGIPKNDAQALAQEFPVRSRQQLPVLDWLQRRRPELLNGDAAGYLAKAIREDLPPPEGFGKLPRSKVEYALLPTFREGAKGVLRRDLSAYRIEGQGQFEFKARSEVKRALQVRFQGPGATARAEVHIKKSEGRQKYRIPLSSFEKSSPDFKWSAVQRVFFEELTEPGPGRLWLDNLSFFRPAQTLRFEIVKLVHCAVPTLVGLAIFVFLLWALRVEEAHELAGWIREKGMAKIRNRLKRS